MDLALACYRSTRPAGALPGAACAPRPSLGAARGALHARLRGLGGWLAVRCTASALRLARVEWHGWGVCRASTPSGARGASRFDGGPHGIDETSYKKGHKYVTVVVDHDRGCLIWAHEGTGKDVLNLFLDEAHAEQRRAIEVVTADGRGG